MQTVLDPAPSDLAGVLSPEWLTGILAPRHPGIAVTGVEVVETLATQATKVRIALTIDGGGADAPRALCIKGVLTDTGASPASSITETRFYRDLAAGLPIRLPRAEYAALSAGEERGVVVMRDLIAEDGVAFCSALSPFSVDQAAAGLDLLADLHLSGPEGSAFHETPWIPRFLDMIAERPILPTAMLQGLLDDPRGDPLEPALRDAARLEAALLLLAQRMRAGRQCVLHGDAHAGNWYHTRVGAPGLVDWQVLQKGKWAQDVAYFIAAVLPPEVRREQERHLLAHYLGRMTAGGVETGADAAWEDYRAAMVYGFYLWSITRKVEPVLTREFVRRLGTAVADLESYAVIGA